MSVCQYVRLSICHNELFSLGIKMKVVQNAIRGCQTVSMSIFQNATFQLRYQNESCSECHQDIGQSLCQYVRMQLFSLGIKMKIIQNVIIMSDGKKTSTDS